MRYGYAQRTHFEPVRHDVDALWDLAVHDIAIFNTWLEQTPIQVRATGTVFPKSEVPPPEVRRTPPKGGKSTPPCPPQGKSEVRNTEEFLPSPFAFNPLEGLADLVWVTLTYPDGFQAFIHLCWLNPDKQRRLTVVGSLGTLIFDEMLPETPLILQRVVVQIGGAKRIILLKVRFPTG